MAWGFDPMVVDDDRQGGISRSIRARMERMGGRVAITSTPGGRGTNVALTMPRVDRVPVVDEVGAETGAPPVQQAQTEQAEKETTDDRKVR